MLRKVFATLKGKAPTILAVTGCAAVIATAVSTAKATKELDKKDKGNVSLDATDYIQAYTVPFLFGSSAIFCILYSNKINMKQQEELIKAYKLAMLSYMGYRSTIADKHGIEEDLGVLAQVSYDVTQPRNIEKHQDEEIFVDDWMKEPFYSTLDDVISAERELNDLFRKRGWASLGDFYDILGLPRTDITYEFGWSKEDAEELGYDTISFVNTRCMDQDETIFHSITFSTEPLLNFRHFNG